MISIPKILELHTKASLLAVLMDGTHCHLLC